MIQIDVINESTVATDDEVRELVSALQIQVTRDFNPFWGVPCELFFRPKGTNPTPGNWWLALLDDSDQAGALGYHDITDTGLPLGKVFAKSTMEDGGAWSVTASHELLEMLGDPEINLCASVINAEGTQILFYAYETADAVEDDSYGYKIGEVLVSDFVTPAFFEPNSPSGTQLDFQKHVTKPLQILTNGYLSVLDPTNGQGWQQVMGDGAKHRARTRGKIGSRRDKRRTVRTAWLASTKLMQQKNTLQPQQDRKP